MDDTLIPFVKDDSILPMMKEGNIPFVRGNGLTRGNQGSNFPELEEDTPAPDTTPADRQNGEAVKK